MTTGLRPAACPCCLLEDIENGRSQYLRLSWHSSITTVCPFHFIPLVTCCAAWSPDSLAHAGNWSRGKRIHCAACHTTFDPPRLADAGTQSLLAVARMEALLRGALAGDRIVDLGNQLVTGQEFLRFIEDTVWALMVPVPGTQYRVLHELRTPQFPVPRGFNTPVNADNWLSCGPLGVRRSLMAVLASLLSPDAIRDTLQSQAGSRRSFWRSMNSLHCPEDRQAFAERTSRWSSEIIDAVQFY